MRSVKTNRLIKTCHLPRRAWKRIGVYLLNTRQSGVNGPVRHIFAQRHCPQRRGLSSLRVTMWTCCTHILESGSGMLYSVSLFLPSYVMGVQCQSAVVCARQVKPMKLGWRPLRIFAAGVTQRQWYPHGLMPSVKSVLSRYTAHHGKTWPHRRLLGNWVWYHTAPTCI